MPHDSVHIKQEKRGKEMIFAFTEMCLFCMIHCLKFNLQRLEKLYQVKNCARDFWTGGGWWEFNEAPLPGLSTIKYNL